MFIITLNKDLPAEKTQHLKIHKHWPVLSYARKQDQYSVCFTENAQS